MPDDATPRAYTVRLYSGRTFPAPSLSAACALARKLLNDHCGEGVDKAWAGARLVVTNALGQFTNRYAEVSPA